MTLLFLSNGFGEDQIACNILRACLVEQPSLAVQVLPLVGAGQEYLAQGLTPLCQNPPLPSAGFIRNWRSLGHDLCAGLLATLWRQMGVLRQTRAQVTGVVAVGDVFCLLMASLAAGRKPCFFLPTAKSDLFMPHSLLEKFLMKKLATKVYPRDELTAQNLAAAGLPATYLGNLMLSGLQPSGETFGWPVTEQTVLLLPGSRTAAYANLPRLLQLVVALQTREPALKFLLAKAPTLEPPQLAQAAATVGWQLGSDEILLQSATGGSVRLTTKFADALAQANLVIGLAGTANEQAVYCGKPVLCFPAHGSQATRQRFLEQRQLLGSLLHFEDSQHVPVLAKTALGLLAKYADATRKSKENLAAANLLVTETAATRVAQSILATW